MWRTHQSLREGLTLGLIVGTAIWLWLVIIDAVAGQPFRTFHVLGGIALFTVLHYLLCLAYGVAAVAVVHLADLAAAGAGGPDVAVGGRPVRRRSDHQRDTPM